MQEHQTILPKSYGAWTWRVGEDPAALVLAEIDMVQAGPGEALIRNAVIGLNLVDWKVLGNSELGWAAGHVPGVDGAGTVVAVGDDVSQAFVGQRVCYHQNLRKPGSFAQYVAVDARALMRVPDGMDMAVAASFPCPALTAWMALEKLPGRLNSSLLISGAGGAVGQYLVQLAALRGLKVTAMCNPRHWERLLSLGAERCIAGPFGEDQSLPEGEVARFAAVIDSVNADHAMRLAPALAANGHMVCIQGRLEHWPCEPFGRALSMHEVALGPLHQFGSDADWLRLTDAGEQMLFEIAKGRLKAETTVIDDFERLPQLLNALKHRDFSGKPLIRIA